MRGGEPWVARMAAWALAGLVSACAGVPRDASLPIDDPNEQFNRGVLRVNQTVLDPAANVVKTMPGPIRDRLEDLDANLKGPRIFANNILQGRFNAAAITLTRLVFNTTFGLGGMFDVATAGGLPKQSGDFGQTLFVWGVPAGTFVETPYYGPSTQRDAVGGAVDTVADPVGWVMGGIFFGWPWSVGAGALGGHGSPRPMEGGRERLDRLLQLPALRLVSDPPRPICARRSACRPSLNRRPPRDRPIRRGGHGEAGPASSSPRRKR